MMIRAKATRQDNHPLNPSTRLRPQLPFGQPAVVISEAFKAETSLRSPRKIFTSIPKNVKFRLKKTFTGGDAGYGYISIKTVMYSNY